MSSSEPGVDEVSGASGPVTEDAPDREPDPLREELVDRLTALVGDAVVDHHIVSGRDLWIRVRREAWADVAHTVRLTMGARYFGFLSAIDWMPSPFGRSLDSAVDRSLAQEPAPTTSVTPGPYETGFAGGDTRFQVFARFANVADHWGLTLKADVGDVDPSIGTLTKVYAGADWHERETHEMFGIDFVGHPGLRRLYLPGDFEGTPLRKDFPLLARMVKPWPGIVDVEPMPGGDDETGDGDASEATA
ncbi:MAG: NADH-quinone oxidoreductase subunit C [Microthrixaceae bacterium]